MRAAIRIIIIVVSLHKSAFSAFDVPQSTLSAPGELRPRVESQSGSVLCLARSLLPHADYRLYTTVPLPLDLLYRAAVYVTRSYGGVGGEEP